MPEDYLSTPPARGGLSFKALMGSTLLAFAGGASLLGYLVWNGQIALPSRHAQPAPVSANSTFAVAASPSATPGAQPEVSASPTEAALAQVQGGLDQRLAALEQRLARLDLQAAASEGNTARAEGLLIAFAARRAIERGAPLGYLADQLKLRFADAQPNAVKTVIDSAAQPVTLDQLAGKLDGLAPALGSAPAEESGWQKIKREMAGLFVVRHGDTPSNRPEDRLERARLMLRTGQTDQAADEVARMPGSAAANAWIADARRYAAAQRALDLIETTALQATDKLKDGSGKPVEQPGMASPAALPAPSPVPEGTY